MNPRYSVDFVRVSEKKSRWRLLKIITAVEFIHQLTTVATAKREIESANANTSHFYSPRMP